MRSLPILLVLMFFALAIPTIGRSEIKPDPDPAPNHPILRQGGDLIADAVPINQLPYQDTGTTTGYADDYDEACPYTGSTSPDVVYVYDVPASIIPCTYVEIDLFGSTYDTKVYVYDSQLDLIACNDDYYPDYVSRIEHLGLFGGETFYIVVDGYGGDHGDYVLNIAAYECILAWCPPYYQDEGEPPLQDDQPDLFNSGCDGDPSAPAIVPLPVDAGGVTELCGRQGWIRVDGEVRGDVDWFSLVIGPAGVVSGFLGSNLGGIFQVITPGECGGLQIQQTLEYSASPQHPITITGEPGDEVWLRIATRDGEPACGGYTPQEWPYTLVLEGMTGAVAVEERNWSAVKGLFGLPR